MVCSVPGPPCTTSSTIGTRLASVYTRSNSARSWISAPHAAEFSLPLSTSTKCVCCGLSGAPFRSAWRKSNTMMAHG
jgi:hypothetical protein